MAETALVVLVPAADPAVMRHRREHTVSGAEGLGAHVTVLYPFIEAEHLNDAVLAALRDELSGMRRFRLTLARLGRFPPPAVLYAAPEPAQPFMELTQRIAERFDLEPYGGEHEEIVPHLTIACGDDPTVLDRIEHLVAPLLPIATIVDAVHVVERAAGRWGVAATVALR
jgi:2'-5' RNA ligase